MRMWNVNPHLLCQKHLTGEHSEMHMFAASFRLGRKVQGFLRDKLLNPSEIALRHDQLAAEMLLRGMNHQSPLEQPDVGELAGVTTVDPDANLRELVRRCPACRERIEAMLGGERFADIPRGGDAIVQVYEGIWVVKMSGRQLPGSYLRRDRAVKALEDARRAARENNQAGS